MMDVDKIVAAILNGPLPKPPYIAALPMYDWPERRHEVDAQWAQLRDALRVKGVDAPEHLARCNADLPNVDLDRQGFDLAALWQHPNLLFSQCCHGPLELWLKRVHVVGQEDYTGIAGGEGEYYRSAIVMRRFSIEHDPDLVKRLGGLRFAYNAQDSMSGYLALERELEARNAGMDIFGELTVSGSHRNSVRMVALEQADVAAVDAKSWALALQFEPAARELMVVGWTGKRLGLPFITGLPSAQD